MLGCGRAAHLGTDTSNRIPGDSLSSHTDLLGNLNPEREELHRKIIDEHFAGKSPAEGKPVFTIMGGGSASGKSTMIESGAVKLPDNSVVIDSDFIKTKLPEYQAMVVAGDLEAAKFAHEESSALAKRMLKVANDGGFNVVLDGVGAGSIRSLSEKIIDARNVNMTVNGVYATVPTEMAIERAVARASLTGRSVAITKVRELHKSVSEILPECAHLFDTVELYDTTSDVILIATGGSGKGLQIVKGQAELFDAFLQKAFE